MSRALLAAVLLVLVAPAGASACTGGTLKPTLSAEIPSEVAVQDVDGRAYLVFRSGLVNTGRGPLTIVGRRASAGARMRSAQLLECARLAQRPRRVTRIGRMRYVRVPTHQHFHVRDLERYRLVSLPDRTSYSSAKRGFCLGDSYDPGIAIARKPAQAGFDGDLRTACGQGRPGVLRIREGLSVGWGDSYSPLIEGQFVDLTDLSAGRYRLLTEIDPFERLEVGSRAPSTAGVDLDVRWPDGREQLPTATITGSCTTRRSCASRAPVTDGSTTGAAALGRAQLLGGRLG